jgi:GNAT superfamily N-acetyltransferase
LLPIEGAASFGDVVVLSEVGSDEWQRWRAVRLAALEEAPEAFGSTLAAWSGAGARGTGAGVALLAAVQTWAASVGARELALSVKRSNSPAIRLYQRFGFRRSAEAHEDPTEFVMTKPLAEPGASDAPPPGVRTTVSHHASEGEGGGDR